MFPGGLFQYFPMAQEAFLKGNWTKYTSKTHSTLLKRPKMSTKLHFSLLNECPPGCHKFPIVHFTSFLLAHTSLSLVKKHSEVKRRRRDGLRKTSRSVILRISNKSVDLQDSKDASLLDHQLPPDNFLSPSKSRIEGLSNVLGKKSHCLNSVTESVRGIFKVNLCRVLSLQRELRVTRETLCQHSNCLLSIKTLSVHYVYPGGHQCTQHLLETKSRAEVNNRTMIHASIQNHLKPEQET